MKASMITKLKLPHMNKPCVGCPFLKDTLKGWLGEERMEQITDCDSFVCHKEPRKQCAGHMLLLGLHNGFMNLAYRMNVTLSLSGRDKVFNSVQDCIEHHSED